MDLCASALLVAKLRLRPRFAWKCIDCDAAVPTSGPFCQLAWQTAQHGQGTNTGHLAGAVAHCGLPMDKKYARQQHNYWR
jgi:hypothetical protein